MGASFALATPNIRLRRRLRKDNNITRLFQHYYTFVTLQRCGSKRPTKTHLLQKSIKSNRYTCEKEPQTHLSYYYNVYICPKYSQILYSLIY